MFFENFNTVFITLINSKTPFYSFIFFCTIDKNFNVEKKDVHLILEIVFKASDVIKRY